MSDTSIQIEIGLIRIFP